MGSLSQHPESGLSGVSKADLEFFTRPLPVKISAWALFLPENQRKKIPWQVFYLAFLRNEPRAVAAGQRLRQRVTPGPANPTHPQTRKLPAATLPAPGEKTPNPFDRKRQGRTIPPTTRAGSLHRAPHRGLRYRRAEVRWPNVREILVCRGQLYRF